MAAPTGATSLKALQTALYGKLHGDATLLALVTGVYDDVPEDTNYPYVVIGEFTEEPLNAMGKHGKEVTATLHVWSQYKGFAEAYDIANRIQVLLDEVALTVTGYTHVSTQYEFGESIREPDGVTRHIPLRYRIWLEEA